MNTFSYPSFEGCHLVLSGITQFLVRTHSARRHMARGGHVMMLNTWTSLTSFHFHV